MDAQACFDDMVKNVVAPGFRAMGFRGSGRNFYLPGTGGHHALMALAKSRYNWRESCRFSVTLTFWSEQDWAAARREFPELTAKRPAVHTVYGRWPPTWSVDLGELLDPPHGHSWTLTDPAEAPAISDHVLTVVAEAALPALRALAAGGDPPLLPLTDGSFDCPWPYCTNPIDRYNDELDLDAVSEPEPAPNLSPTDLDNLERARLIGVRRSVAWKVVHLSRPKLDRYADLLGAGDELSLSELFTIAALGVDGDYIPVVAWPAARRSIDGWLADPNQAPDARLLVTGSDAQLVLGLPVDPGTLLVVMSLVPLLQSVLSELCTRRLI